MTGLLVSVRDTEEAAAAIRGGADVIDVKEPNHGPLGAATLDVITAIFDFVDGRVPVSAACGELISPPAFPFGSLPKLTFAKLGLAGCGSVSDWPDKFSTSWQRFSPKISRVAVVYADWQQCDGLPPSEVIRVGAQNQCRHLLVDTTDKTRCLLDLISIAELSEWANLAAAHQMQMVVAGSIGIPQLEGIVRSCQPALVAVRGSACEEGRKSKISEKRIAELKQELAKLQPHDSGVC